MKLLVSKKEANVPLYLRLACEELRVYGLFSKVSWHKYSQTSVIRTPIFRKHRIFRIWLSVPIFFAII